MKLFIDALIAFIISMLPVFELRGGLPYAAIRGVPVALAFAICFAGNILPVPFTLLFIRRIFAYLKRFKRIGAIVTKLENRAIAKSDTVRKYQLVGLFLFVAIPLPGTGAWTGSLIAATLNLPIRKSFPVIALGILCAGIIMVVLSYLIPGLFFNLTQ
ncbi:MAG: small multi-drug export protein [Dehalococcoidia bacterium]|nr:small multi-drug export protein [Dehalococcoidia bacterium]